MVRFSNANVKIQALSAVDSIKPFLANKRKVYSFDLLSGHSCPFAKDCLSKVIKIDGRSKIKDGPDTQFRCFSASQEVLFPALYNLRKANFDALKGQSVDYIASAIQSAMPANLGVCRLHVGGDFFSPNYFAAWLKVAIDNPSRLFYAYTKSLTYWTKNIDLVNSIPNLVLSASYGGRCDVLINSFGLRSARVVFSVAQAEELGLEIDHTDEHAADPTTKSKDFALLIHGQQPANSEASQAIKTLKKSGTKFSYSKVKSLTTV
jgi:hypothetical protein